MMSTGNSTRLHNASCQSMANMTISVTKNVKMSENTLIRPEESVSERVFT